jgi:hypothetical protein
MNTEKKRIPFDWEKYQSGEYEAVCRDDKHKPEQIMYYPNATSDYKLSAFADGAIRTYTENGYWRQSKESSPLDILLIPKPKKFQAWVNLYSDGLSINYRSEYMAKELVDVHLENGREFIETRLIEWEG